MKRLLLVLALAPAAAAEDADRLTALAGRAWSLHEALAKDPSLANDEKTLEELRSLSSHLPDAIRNRYPRLENPACYVYSFPEGTKEADRARVLGILEARLASLGAKDARVLTHGGARLYVLLNRSDEKTVDEDLACVAWPGPIEFRLEADEAARASWKESGKAPKGTSAFEAGPGADPVLAEEAAALDGRLVKSASVTQEDGRTTIRLTLTDAGGEVMRKVTSANLKRRMAIVTGSRVLSAPVIQGEIGKDVSISGNFTPEEAARIVAVFNAGTLPCRLETGPAWSALLVEQDEEAWQAEPLAQFPDRMLENNLVHAILEDALRKGDPRAYEGVLKFVEARAGEGPKQK